MADSTTAPSRRRPVVPRAVAAAVLATALVASPAGADTLNVTISGLAFSPASAPVQMVAGEPGFPAAHAHVKWTMADPGTEHTVTFDDPRLTSSARLAPGQAHEVVFSAAGTFPYRCTIHPAMTGTVMVSPPLAAPAASAPTAAASGEEEGDGGSGGVAVPILLGLAVLAAGGLLWFLLRASSKPNRG